MSQRPRYPKSQPIAKDGRWYEHEWFLEVAGDHLLPDEIDAVVARLEPIFPASMLAAPGFGGPKYDHPFSAELHGRGLVPNILCLGLALDILDAPPQLTRDLSDPRRYTSRCFEIWVAAFLRSTGASLEYCEEEPEHTAGGKLIGKRPEFIAVWGTHRIAVEVKQLEEGDFEKQLQLAQGAFVQTFMGRWYRFPEAVTRWADPDCVLGADWSTLFGRQDHLRREANMHADRVEVVVGSPRLPGRYRLGPFMYVDLLGAPKQTESLQFSFDGGEEKLIRRLQTSTLKKCREKFRDVGLPGIVFVRRPFWPAWPHSVVGAIVKDLEKSSWASSTAAVLFQSSFGECRTFQIGQGRCWDQLPVALRDLLLRGGTCSNRNSFATNPVQLLRNARENL